MIGGARIPFLDLSAWTSRFLRKELREISKRLLVLAQTLYISEQRLPSWNAADSSEM
jgi:hypothetical protein